MKLLNILSITEQLQFYKAVPTSRTINRCRVHECKTMTLPSHTLHNVWHCCPLPIGHRAIFGSIIEDRINETSHSRFFASSCSNRLFNRLLVVFQKLLMLKPWNSVHWTNFFPGDDTSSSTEENHERLQLFAHEWLLSFGSTQSHLKMFDQRLTFNQTQVNKARALKFLHMPNLSCFWIHWRYDIQVQRFWQPKHSQAFSSFVKPFKTILKTFCVGHKSGTVYDSRLHRSELRPFMNATYVKATCQAFRPQGTIDFSLEIYPIKASMTA